MLSSVFFGATASGLVTVANELLQGPLEVVINLLVIGAAVIGVLFVCYLLIQYLCSSQGHIFRQKLCSYFR